MSRPNNPLSLLGRVRELYLADPGISNADIFAKLEADFRNYDSVYLRRIIGKYKGRIKKQARRFVK